MNQKKKIKILEFIILVVIIAAITFTFFLAKSLIDNEPPLSDINDIQSYSVNKIHKYQVLLDNVKNYNVPFNRYIDTRSSTYEIYIKSTDNIITDITEVINIDYLDGRAYTIEEIDNINNIAINGDSFNEGIDESNIGEDEEIDGSIVMEDISDEVASESSLPYNWIDIYNYPVLEYNDDVITNYCNGYNDIESFYSLQCNKKNNNIKILNNYDLNSINGYILKTKNLEITLPVKRKTKLTDYLNELKKMGVEATLVDKID